MAVQSNQIMAGIATIGLGEEGLRRLANSVAAPFSYIRNLAPEVRAILLQHHLDRGDLGEKITVLTRNGDLIGFASSYLLRLRAEDVLDAILEGIGTCAQKLEIYRLAFFNESFELDLLGHELEQEVVPGDIVSGGLRVTHSLVGEHATWVEGFVLRLVCSNGMTHRECVSRRPPRSRRLPAWHPNAEELQREQLRNLARDAWNSLGQKLSAVKSLAGQQLEFEPLVSRWVERARLSTKALMPLLRGAWAVEGSQPTTYAVMNALTRVATHEASLNHHQRRILARLAGLLAFRQLHLCPRCFSLLAGPASAGVDPQETIGKGHN
jgi:hypothetical protein